MGVPPRYRPVPSGTRFKKLVVLDHFRDESGRLRYRCICDCGNETTVAGSNLNAGNTGSCGCWRGKTHGMTDHPLYVTWCSMRSRCLQPNQLDYPDYGGRGITVCDRWLDKDGFPNFVADMGEKPEPSYLLDRIDNDGSYSPENCRWATPAASSANKRQHGDGKRAQWRERALVAARDVIGECVYEYDLAYGLDLDGLTARIVDAIAEATRYSARYKPGRPTR